MTKLLTENEIEQELPALTGWSLTDNAITRTFTLPSFPAALAFASAVGHLAERADHHPDILIQYRKVALTLSTHSAGGLTEQDFDLATEINAIA
ncbi:MAG TPA: 4a-hydroxytetrahydrobiopterin dehydratase [Anaerolineae bacterium]|nr:4a-hydroxytetrahydrobiopterin dehydratase [Anaerolineae bacterium]